MAFSIESILSANSRDEKKALSLFEETALLNTSYLLVLKHSQKIQINRGTIKAYDHKKSKQLSKQITSNSSKPRLK